MAVPDPLEDPGGAGEALLQAGVLQLGQVVAVGVVGRPMEQASVYQATEDQQVVHADGTPQVAGVLGLAELGLQVQLMDVLLQRGDPAPDRQVAAEHPLQSALPQHPDGQQQARGHDQVEDVARYEASHTTAQQVADPAEEPLLEPFPRRGGTCRDPLIVVRRVGAVGVQGRFVEGAELHGIGGWAEAVRGHGRDLGEAQEARQQHSEDGTGFRPHRSPPGVAPGCAIPCVPPG